MKKVIAVIILLSLTAVFLSACQSETPKVQTPDTPVDIPDTDGGGQSEPESTYWDILGERDFGGYTFTILDANEKPDLWVNVAEELNGDPINDALFNRNLFVEEKFGLKLKYEQIEGHGPGTKALRNSILAGDDLYDMIIGRCMSGELDGLATNGSLYNLVGLPHLSLESPWWSRLMYQGLQFDGMLFFTMGDIVPSMYNGPTAMFFNKKMYQDYGRTDNLYELVFSGKWTLDVLERLTKDVYQDVNDDGKMHAHDDIFGLVLEHNSLASNKLAVSTGINLSTIKDGTIAVDFNSQHVVDRVSKITQAYRTNEKVYPVELGELHEIINRTFAENRAMFLVHFVESSILHLRAMEQDYGILPLPKYDEQQESYISFMNPWTCAFVGIPSSADAERSAFVMEAMAYASYNTVRPKIYDVVFNHKASRDEESAQIIDIIIESSYLDLNGIYNWGGSTDILSNAVFLGGEIVSAFEKAEPKIQSAIDKYIKSLDDN